MKSRTLLGATVALLVLGGGSYTGLNTNFLGPENLCHGLVKDATVQEAFPGGGRLSDSDGSDPLLCTVSLSEVGIADDDITVDLRVVSKAEKFPFERGLWEANGSSGIFTDGSSGVVDEGGGWALLPEGCVVGDVLRGSRQRGERTIVNAAIVEGQNVDSLGLARMLGEIAHNVAVRSNCDASSVRKTSQVETAEPTTRTDIDSVCSLPALDIPKLNTQFGRPVENLSGKPPSAWLCDLSFKDGPYPYTRFAVVQDSTLVAGIATDPVYYMEVQKCKGKKTYFMMDHNDFPWSPEERLKAGLPSEAAFFAEFVGAAAEKMGCSVPGE